MIRQPTGNPPPTRKTRLSADARRRQILDVAARMLSERGVAGVEITEVAAHLGVTRPVVYRLFPTRLALLEAVLVDFEQELAARTGRAMLSLLQGSLSHITEAFVAAFCDTIEVKGKGAFHLMFALLPDQDASKLGRQVLLRILAPFMPAMARMTGLSDDQAACLTEVVVAAGRSAVDGWLEGPLTREEAVTMATRAVTGVLVAFGAEG